jgi:hypothetical protein
MVEPVFDPIKAAVIMCGAIPKYIPLRARPDEAHSVLNSDNLYIDRDEVRFPLNLKRIFEERNITLLNVA